MTDVLSAVTAALKTDQNRLEQASLNAANAATPGYKRGAIVAFGEIMNAQQASASAQGDVTWKPAPIVLSKVTDFTAGSLQQTGRPLDIAVEGKGFVQLSNGTQTWLTRTAALRVNEQGELVGPKGLRVVGSQGDIRPGSADNLTISANGEVSRGEQALGRIRLVSHSDEAQLMSGDGVLFEVDVANLQDAPANQGLLRVGFLEGSNTSNLQEMLGVMESVRHFESLIRLAQGYDEVLGKAIQKLGEV
jgi:flagellar basal-body rod protein FlgF